MFNSEQDSDISGNLLSLETQVADNPDLIYDCCYRVGHCLVPYLYLISWKIAWLSNRSL
jgi:hypothetical protein